MHLAHRDDGVIAILVAAMALLLFGLAAIVVDLGFARQVRGEAQDTADAAALAGADALFTRAPRPNFADALAAVSSTAVANFGAPSRLSRWRCPTPELPPGGLVWDGGARSGTPCVQFGRQPGRPTSQVFVATPTRHVSALFGGIFGSDGLDISRSAVAGSTVNRLPSCAVCVHGSMTVEAGGRVQVGGGSSLSVLDAAVPPTTPASVVVRDRGAITFQSTAPVRATGSFDPDPPTTGVPVDDQDPLSPLAAPPPGAFVAPDRLFTCDGSRRPRPGRYQDFAVTDDCDLRNGVFHVSGTLSIDPDVRLEAQSATLVFESAARLVNQGELRLGHARDSNLSIYWGSTGVLDLAQADPLSIDGDVYAPAATRVEVSAPRLDLGGVLVASQLLVRSGNVLNVDERADSVRIRQSELGLVR